MVSNDAERSNNVTATALPESIEAAMSFSNFKECCFCRMQSLVGWSVEIGEPLFINVTI